MDANNLLNSKTVKILLFVIAEIILLMLAFKAGMFMGYNQVLYSYRWGENYHKNFAGPRQGFFAPFTSEFREKDFINPHGDAGTILKIDGNIIIIKGKDNVEKTILTTDKTDIQSRRDSVKITDLKTDDQIVVIGSPNDKGQIEAKFIRLFR